MPLGQFIGKWLSVPVACCRCTYILFCIATLFGKDMRIGAFKRKILLSFTR